MDQEQRVQMREDSFAFGRGALLQDYFAAWARHQNDPVKEEECAVKAQDCRDHAEFLRFVLDKDEQENQEHNDDEDKKDKEGKEDENDQG